MWTVNVVRGKLGICRKAAMFLAALGRRNMECGLEKEEG